MGQKKRVNQTGRAVPMSAWEPWSRRPGSTIMWQPSTSTPISGAWIMSSRGSSSWTIGWWGILQGHTELEQWCLLQVSQTATLAFLAVWHGWHAGYYITFFNEFIVISFEKDFSTVWNKSVRVARYQSFKNPIWVCFFISIFSDGRSILLTPLSQPPLAGNWLYSFVLCSHLWSSFDRCYVFFFLPHCFLAFPLLGWNRFWPVYQVNWPLNIGFLTT